MKNELRKRLFAEARANGWSNEQILHFIQNQYGMVGSTADLDEDVLRYCIGYFSEWTPFITPNQVKRLITIANANGWNDVQQKQYIFATHGISSRKMITIEIYDDICKHFENNKPTYQAPKTCNLERRHLRVRPTLFQGCDEYDLFAEIGLYIDNEPVNVRGRYLDDQWNRILKCEYESLSSRFAIVPLHNPNDDLNDY